MTDNTIDRSAADRRGTIVIIVGTAVSAMSVLVYEAIAGRSLGAEGFAPIGVLWTIGFMVFTVLMLPVEQFITRLLVLAGGAAGAVAARSRLIVLVLGGAVVVGVAFAWLSVDQFFAGNPTWVWIVLTIMITRAALASARGFLAGRRRFAAYGAAVAMEGLTLVVLAAGAALADLGATSYGWAMAVAPLTVFVLRPFRPAAWSGPVHSEGVSASAFLGWLLVATASAQLVLAGGPIVVGLIGGSSAAVSVFFVTFTLFRGPITSAYNLVARVLPDFTAMAAQGRTAELHRWAWRLLTGGLALAALSAAAAGILGADIVGAIYGSEFTPTSLVAALGGAGVGAGLAVLFVQQIYVAAGSTRSLAAGWLAALAIAAGAIAFTAASDPVLRVAVGFAAGEIAALLILGLGVALGRR